MVEQDDRLLLVKRAKIDRRPGTAYLEWTFPGGKVRPGEDIGEAVEREVMEETGYSVSATEQIARTRHPNSARTVIYFACKHIDKPVLPHEDEAIANIAWVPKGQVQEGYLMQPLHPPSSPIWGLSSKLAEGWN